MSTYRSLSFSVRWPQYATAAGVVSSAANTTQITAAIVRPRGGRCGGAVSPVGVIGDFGLGSASVWDMGSLLPTTSVGLPGSGVVTQTM